MKNQARISSVFAHVKLGGEFCFVSPETVENPPRYRKVTNRKYISVRTEELFPINSTTTKVYDVFVDDLKFGKKPR